MTPHKDYPDQDFAQLKHSDTLTFIIWRGQSHLNSHTDFTSTWLYPVAFHHYIRNINSLTSKYSELLASHYSNLRSEGHLCPYPSRATLDSRVLHSLITVQWWCTLTSHLYTISMSPYFLVTKISPYGTQWFILDKYYYPSNNVSFSHEQV